MKNRLSKAVACGIGLQGLPLYSGILLIPLVLFHSSAMGQLLLRDDFNGVGNVDTTVWRIPFGEEGTFLGRTQLKTDPATDIPQQGGGVVTLELDTFSPLDAGNQFLGSELLTKRNFARGGGLSFEARMRLVSATGGLVNGFFSFDTQRDVPPGAGNLVRDEIDLEILSNETVGGSDRPATNFWNDGPFTGAGSGGSFQSHAVPGVDLTEFQNYRVLWQPDQVQWFVNDVLVRTQTTDVPDDPMKVRFNLWAPDSSFAQAYDADLVPAATLEENQTYTVEVDYVEIKRLSTAAGPNLLSDPSFEDGLLVDVGGVPPSTTGEWIKFNNAFVESAVADPTLPVVSGTQMFKAFGPFKGFSDASGVFQNVPAVPGQEFEASVFAQSSTVANSGLDPIAGTKNFATLAISFLDQNGAVLREAFGDLDVNTNGKDFSLLNGRDPNLAQDQFVPGTVNAVAPANTSFARLTLFFHQPYEPAGEGGAVYYDDAYFGLLSSALTGDMDCDNDIDFDDIDEFVLGLNDPQLYESVFGLAPSAKGDTDLDGDLDFDDIAGFVDLLSAGRSAALSQVVPEPGTWLLLVCGGCIGLVRLTRRSAKA